MSGLRVALVGYGYWGPNLARNLAALPDVELAVVCELDDARRAEARRMLPTARFADYDDVLSDRDVDAVVVATPARTHYELACRALESGKHVLVEKPLAMTVSDCEDLGGRADRAGLTLMVGHTFLYNSAVRWLRDHVQGGHLGDVLYVHAQRLNLGRVRRDVNVLWNLAPHDVSILLYVLDADPVAVSARGRGYLRSDVEDVVFVDLEFPDGGLGHLHLSWLDPRKVRQVTVVGTRNMVVYDDIDTESRIRVYDKGIDVMTSLEDSATRRHQSLGEFQAVVRSGDLLVPRIDFEEPLRVECREFVDAITQRRAPLTDAGHASRVVRVLAAASESLRNGGARLPLRELPER
jgi:predicted dehydrogenase